MGRKKKEITPAQWKKIGEYALNGCMNATIEGLMDWPNGFIEHRNDISKFLLKKRQERKLKLRKRQNDDKSTAMSIFLGKNELGQADTHDVKHSGEIKIVAPTIK